MRKLIIISLLAIFVLSVGCSKNVVIVKNQKPKSQTVEEKTEIHKNEKTEFPQKEDREKTEEQTWNKIKMLYIDVG